MARPIPASLPGFLKRVECVRYQAYRDSAGVWTIGVGHTGPEVHPGGVWTESQVDLALARDIQVAANRLATVVKPAAITFQIVHLALAPRLKTKLSSAAYW